MGTIWFFQKGKVSNDTCLTIQKLFYLRTLPLLPSPPLAERGRGEVLTTTKTIPTIQTLVTCTTTYCNMSAGITSRRITLHALVGAA